MITAIVLVNTLPDAVSDAAQIIADIGGVYEIYSCSGEVDLIAILRVPRVEQVQELVVERIAKIRGVSRTSTHIAFRSYSTQHESGGFSVGFDRLPASFASTGEE